MSRSLTFAFAAAALVVSTSANAWEPAVVGLDGGATTDVARAGAVTEPSPESLARASAAARVTPEMVSEAAIAEDVGYAPHEVAPASATYAASAAKVIPEMVSEAALEDAFPDTSERVAGATAEETEGFGSGAVIAERK